jgi:hypothetical protein
MKVRYKLLLVVVGIVVLAIGAGLVTVGSIGRSRGVSRVPVPSGSKIDKLATDADYADSYTSPGSGRGYSSGGRRSGNGRGDAV